MLIPGYNGAFGIDATTFNVTRPDIQYQEYFFIKVGHFYSFIQAYVLLSRFLTPRVKGDMFLTLPHTCMLAVILFYHVFANCVYHIVIVCFVVLMMPHL